MIYITLVTVPSTLMQRFLGESRASSIVTICGFLFSFRSVELRISEIKMGYFINMNNSACQHSLPI